MLPKSYLQLVKFSLNNWIAVFSSVYKEQWYIGIIHMVWVIGKFGHKRVIYNAHTIPETYFASKQQM